MRILMVFLTAILLLSFSGFCLAKDHKKSKVYSYSIPDKFKGSLLSKDSGIDTVIRGKYFRVMLSAVDDFSNTLTSNHFKQDYPEDSGFGEYASRLENYNILLREGDEGFVVIFQLKLNEKYPQKPDAFQDTLYLVDYKTYQLLRKEVRKYEE